MGGTPENEGEAGEVPAVQGYACKTCGAALGTTTRNKKYCWDCYRQRKQFRDRVERRMKGLLHGDGATETIGKMLSSSKDKTAIAANDPARKAPKVLARYSFPLGANEAVVLITGEALVAADFDSLLDYAAMFKKQFERKQMSP